MARARYGDMPTTPDAISEGSFIDRVEGSIDPIMSGVMPNRAITATREDAINIGSALLGIVGVASGVVGAVDYIGTQTAWHAYDPGTLRAGEGHRLDESVNLMQADMVSQNDTSTVVCRDAVNHGSCKTAEAYDTTSSAGIAGLLSDNLSHGHYNPDPYGYTELSSAELQVFQHQLQKDINHGDEAERTQATDQQLIQGLHQASEAYAATLADTPTPTMETWTAPIGLGGVAIVALCIGVVRWANRKMERQHKAAAQSERQLQNLIASSYEIDRQTTTEKTGHIRSTLHRLEKRLSDEGLLLPGGRRGRLAYRNELLGDPK